MRLFAAVLAGGSGTRFWPASTRDVPKQMLPLGGGAPLLREAVDRLAGLVPPERTVIVTAARSAAATAALLPELGAQHVVGEPRARNTAAACAVAAHWVRARDPEGVLVVLPADHVVRPAEELRAALAAAAARAATSDRLLTLGLRPAFAATGYGWIETGDETARPDGRPVVRVVRFTEKPDRERAEAFLAGGRHLWNLGMFAWRADAFLDELAHRLSGVAGPCAPLTEAFRAGDAGPALVAAFDACEAISVDHGVLEHSERVECLPCSFTWDDLGSFPALLRHLAADSSGNVAVGDLVSEESSGCIAWNADGGLTALLGVRDLVVVHAGGVTLVAPVARAEEIKRLVAETERRGLGRFL